MLIPIGSVHDMPVVLLRVTPGVPSVSRGALVHFDGEVFEVKVPRAEPGAFPDGEQLLVEFDDPAQGYRRTRVVSSHKDRIRLKLLGRHHRQERRYFPRIDGYVPLSYRELGIGARRDLEAWLRHPHLRDASLPDEQAWITPDPEMEFSATGLRFEDSHSLPAGMLLCLKFRLPEISDKVYTCGGEVVRTDRLGPSRYAVAVAFTGMSGETSEALMEYTRRRQEELLGLDQIPDMDPDIE